MYICNTQRNLQHNNILYYIRHYSAVCGRVIDPASCSIGKWMENGGSEIKYIWDLYTHNLFLCIHFFHIRVHIHRLRRNGGRLLWPTLIQIRTESYLGQNNFLLPKWIEHSRTIEFTYSQGKRHIKNWGNSSLFKCCIIEI